MSIKAFIFYACLSSPPQTDHLIVAQHPQEGLRDRKHRGKERLCRCILPCPLLSRSDSSSLSNIPTISLIKEKEEEELSYFPPLSPLRSKLLTPLNFRKTPFTAFIWALIQSRRACRFFQKWCSIWKRVPLGRRDANSPCTVTFCLTCVSHTRCDSCTCWLTESTNRNWLNAAKKPAIYSSHKWTTGTSRRDSNFFLQSYFAEFIVTLLD